MDEHDWLAEQFEDNRTQLRAVAYRMLGSVSESDDAVQEAWLRLSRSDTNGVENLGGWLTTVVARVCLDMLRSRRSRREEPLGAHLPDPVVSRQDGIDPEHEALLADSVGPALLVILETLAPAERLASCCTTCSQCPSTRSPLSWDAPRPRQGSSPAAHAAGYRERPRFPTPVSRAGEKLSTPSSLPRATVTSTRLLRCSTRTSCSEPTAQVCKRAHRGSSAARRPWPAPSRGVPGSHNRRS
jgi:RNA polymerase sigma factor (sigma-70 family)